MAELYVFDFERLVLCYEKLEELKDRVVCFNILSPANIGYTLVAITRSEQPLSKEDSKKFKELLAEANKTIEIQDELMGTV